MRNFERIFYDAPNKFCIKFSDHKTYKDFLVFLEEKGFSWAANGEKPTARDYYIEGNEERNVIGVEKFTKHVWNNFFGEIFDSRKARKQNLEEDPWDEENWGFLDESNNFDSFKHIFDTTPDEFCVKFSDPISYKNFLAFLEDEGFLWGGSLGRPTSLNYWYEDCIFKFVGVEKSKKYVWNNEMDTIVTFDDNIKKRKLNLENDPWGEEDWGYVEERMINENKEEYIIGDVVKLGGEVDSYKLENITGTIHRIIERCGGIHINSDIHGNIKGFYTGLAYFIKEIDWWVSPYNIIGPKTDIKRKHNLEDDPWGEENWGWEEIKESDNFDSFENIFDNAPDKFSIRFSEKESYKNFLVFLENKGFFWGGSGQYPTMRNYWYGINRYIGVVKSERKIWDQPVGEVYDYDKTLTNKKRKHNLEDDPWGEEDWGYLDED